MLLYPGTFSIQCISIDWWFLFLNNLYSNHCLVSFQVFPTFYREFILQVVTNFGNSLKYGNQYIYQSMPRMLTLWLDYGSEVTESTKLKSSQGKREGASLDSMTIFLRKLNEV